jgi:hypothetical protein
MKNIYLAIGCTCYFPFPDATGNEKYICTAEDCARSFSFPEDARNEKYKLQKISLAIFLFPDATGNEEYVHCHTLHLHFLIRRRRK